MRFVCAVVVCAGCTFGSPHGGSGGDDTTTPPDATADGSLPGAPFIPMHVPSGGRTPGTGDLELTQPIDTGALTVGGSQSLPVGVVFDAWPQPGGVELAVLHVRRLHVPTGVPVRVLGRRALVVVASDSIVIEGVLDGSAQRAQPGPGGAGPGAGPGAGRAGSHQSNFRDTGGSGGGFAGSGGNGGFAGTGSCLLAGPSGGPAYGDPMLAVLVAGSGGGAVNSSSCGIRDPGAGGGAIQLSAAVRVSVAGGINVGGGGGGGGRAQSGAVQCDMSAGSGGGSGGAIFLQSPIVEVPGTLAANGGGGGSSGGDPDGNDAPPENDGQDGQNGQLAATSSAGGMDVGYWSSAGGAGGVTTSGGTGLGDSNCDSNGGGGGGGAGRITVALPPDRSPSLTGTLSPAGVRTMY